MKRLMRYIIMLSIAFWGIACQNDELTPQGEGGFDISLTDEPTGAMVRMLPYELSDELKAQFDLKIVNADGISKYTGTVGNYNTGAAGSDATGAFAPGDYTLTATYGNNAAVALDAPFYASHEVTGTIVAGERTSVTLPCHVANALASFSFTDTDRLTEVFSSYHIETVVGDEKVSCTADDGQNPYFSAGSTVEFHLVGKLTSNNSDFSYKFATIDAAEAQKNYCFSISLGDAPEGSANLDITVETSVNSVSISETVPQEWLPKPKMTTEGFTAGTLNYCETEDAPTTAIDYQAIMPVEDVELTINFNDPIYKAINKTYSLASLSESDRMTLTNAGFTLPEMNVQTGKIDFTTLVNKLQCLQDGGTAINQITARVKANKRWCDAQTLTITTARPEFNITVTDNDSWSKEFAVRSLNITAGNAERIKANTEFQYSADGGTTWIICNKGQKQMFSTSPEQKNYKVRAFYRNKLASNVADVTLETPIAIPNGDMENWTDETYSGRYCFYPWGSDKGTCHWDTNNCWTTRHRWNASTFRTNYNGFHAVSYVPGHTGKLAAEVRSTANGRGNTKWFGSISTKDINRVAGQLLLGTAEAINNSLDASGDDTYNVYKNAEFTMRPTGIKFWYKYKMCDSSKDAWNVHMELIDANNAVIAQNDYTSNKVNTDTWTEMTMELPIVDGQNYEKAKYLYIIFSSTVTTGSNMGYTKQTYTYYYNMGANTATYDDACVGAILTIDDIELIYDK